MSVMPNRARRARLGSKIRSNETAQLKEDVAMWAQSAVTGDEWQAMIRLDAMLMVMLSDEDGDGDQKWRRMEEKKKKRRSAMMNRKWAASLFLLFALLAQSARRRTEGRKKAL